VNGFVYVATSDGYRDEAVRSVASLKAAMPDALTCLVSNTPLAGPHAFDDVIVRSDVEGGPSDKMLCIHAPFDRAVFLDTDTLVTGDLGELFRILDRFDVAALPETRRGWDYDLENVSHAFAEFNTGVIAFRRTSAVESFFADWRSEYQRLREVAGLTNDQPAFRSALWRSGLHVAPIPSEYHFLSGSPNYIMWDARLIHGRGDLQKVAVDVNRVLGARAYVPNVGVVPGYRGRRNWFNETVRLFWRMTRLVMKQPTDPASLAPVKWWIPPGKS
jgi:hypothetical protein